MTKSLDGRKDPKLSSVSLEEQSSTRTEFGDARRAEDQYGHAADGCSRNQATICCRGSDTAKLLPFAPRLSSP